MKRTTIKLVSAVRRAALAMALSALAGCALGPNFREPAAPTVDRYTQVPLPEATTAADTAGGDAQRFLEGANVSERWWATFGNAELVRRVEMALQHSPTVTSAQAALRQAEESARAAGGALLPGVDANVGAAREKVSPAQSAGAFPSASGPLNVFNAGVNVGYVFDLFGGVRRGIEARRAQADVQRAQLEATYLALAANVVTASFREASLRAQVHATGQIIDSLEQELEITRKQQAIGTRSSLDTLAVRSRLAATRATLPPLRKQLAAIRNQLATYLGVTPAQLALQPVTLDAITLPRDVPVSVPSRLVAQRPDIRAAAARLHAATAGVGVATANLLPQLTLSGTVGSQALGAGDLLSAGTGVWSLGLNILQPLFHGGELLHGKRAAEAGMDQALADWRQVVLVAFQNVGDALDALVFDADALRAQAAAERDAAQFLNLTREQYRVGAVGYLNLLAAEQQDQRARIDLIQARSMRLADTAALYAALGGGFEESQAVDGRPGLSPTQAMNP